MISHAEKTAIEHAIAEEEARTSGEIVVVIARASSDYYYVPYMWAALVALVVPWPLIHWTWMPVQMIYIIQLGVFAALALLLHYPPLRYALVPGSVRRKRVHQRAAQQFVAQDIHTTAGHTGVLLFVSQAERRAEILVDAGIHEKVPDAEWKKIVDRLTDRIGRGEPAAGLEEAVHKIGEHLATHFPPDATKENLLPNHLVMLNAD
ncbi:hypothetical protein T281_06510 [Rhodomicrobium udaipurense JA643]|uniref:TPM domain-containing protein n=1 Tax=Rhodomicrobium udaipurense TaxID=1202716 RepID=A0A8I1KJK0_9HYPH|nr:TPM domain-containing protein [Rhodomicrobium udaipurense]KAI95235.1 hypothetical protein T281_06510 [Rhodomicrobium udaipurense JA643]MBJ7543011.1 TPM domain-containing protein [Rhodomicrobium udaipurense]